MAILTPERAHEEYTGLGYDAISLRPLSKLPLARAWQTRPTFRQWHNAPANSNIGLRAGNGKAFIDCDDKNRPGAFKNVLHWLAGLGYEAGLLPIVQTASGVGRHVYVNFTGALLGSRRNLTGSMGAGDFRYGPASFVAAPPSVVEGNEYRLLQGDLSNPPSVDLHDIGALVHLNDAPAEERGKARMSPLARALANGQGVDRYKSRSEAEGALIPSLINSGFDFASIRAIFDTSPCAGCYAGKHKNDGWFYRQYQAMVEYSHNESSTRKTIAGIQEAARLAAWANTSDKNVFIAHTVTAYKAGRLTYAVSVRDLALASGASLFTASRATQRLIRSDLISLDTPGAATLANVYALQVDKVKHFLRTPLSGSVSSCPLPEWATLATHDAFRNGAGKKRRLGQRAGQIYQALWVKPQTIVELGVSTGASTRTIKRALVRMSSVLDRATGEVIQMVTCEAGVWRANIVDLNLIAAIMDSYGATGKAREGFERDRRDHARRLEIGAAEIKALAQETHDDMRERADLWAMGHGR